jgi:hypothetical protein
MKNPGMLERRKSARLQREPQHAAPGGRRRQADAGDEIGARQRNNGELRLRHGFKIERSAASDPPLHQTHEQSDAHEAAARPFCGAAAVADATR